MLNRSIFELGLGTLLGGENVVQALASSLSGTTFELGSLLEACREALRDDLDHTWPGRFRLNELELASRVLVPPALFASGAFPALENAVNALVRMEACGVRYPPGEAGAFARLAVDVEPTVLAAWEAARQLRRGAIGRAELAALVKSPAPFFVPLQGADRPVAENHAHLGGIGGDAIVVAQVVLGSTKPESDAQQRCQDRLHWLLRLHADAWLAGAKPESFDQALSRACSGNTIPGESPGLPNWPTLADSFPPTIERDAAWLLSELARAASKDLVTAWPWLLIALCHAFQAPDCSPKERVSLLLALGDTTRLRRTLIMSGQGLRRFAERYYRAELRETMFEVPATFPSQCRDVARRLFPSASDCAELKVSPKGFDSRRLAPFAKAFCGMESDERPGLLVPRPDTVDAERRHRQRLEQVHFCVHFLRPKAAEKSRSALRKDVWEKATQLKQLILANAGWNEDAFCAAAGATHEFKHQEWLRGLDVAGDETAWPIEYFAPPIRWLRSGEDDDLKRSFHLTIHSGEDYAHPLSGLRHVDETIVFCEMGNGDRLGHALALGILPATWLNRQQDVMVPVDEHVDNLVWAWDRLQELRADSQRVDRVCRRLEARIAVFTPHVSWLAPPEELSLLVEATPAEFSRIAVPLPALLAQAWRLRRNCPQQLQLAIGEAPPAPGRLSAAIPDAALLLDAARATPPSAAGALYLARARDEAAKPSRQETIVNVRQRFGRVLVSSQVSARPPTGSAVLLQDEDDEDDVEAMEMLQDLLLERCRTLGVSIEANPSSNVYISRMEHYGEHPIFRWHPPDAGQLAAQAPCNRFGLRTGRVDVLINTDDQGIIPTSLRGEFDLIREAAMAAGVSPEDAEAWLDGIRTSGIAHFERNHRSVFASLSADA